MAGINIWSFCFTHTFVSLPSLVISNCLLTLMQLLLFYHSLGSCYYPHFTHMKAEAQRVLAAFLRLITQLISGRDGVLTEVSMSRKLVSQSSTRAIEPVGYIYKEIYCTQLASAIVGTAETNQKCVKQLSERAGWDSQACADSAVFRQNSLFFRETSAPFLRTTNGLNQAHPGYLW